ncbi:MAG: carbon starvation protein A, partial [Candidatus Hydrogenedentes bacterium]|nr:carbon starvation protein A [Candidatus Hydrogenedentota bacterium]
PIEPKFLLSQHFSAIAAAGPIVGPILAGVMFGWLPALLWILAGSIFIGGVHDMGSLVASIRHKARSIAEVVREHMSPLSYILFLIFIWIALVYIVVAFTDIVASSFIGTQTLENGMTVTGAGIASSSLLYLALPIVMGVLLKFTKLSLNWATIMFLPLVGVAIWVGQYIPFDLAALFNLEETSAHKVWDVVLLAYCFAASLVPMWLLLQPRGHLGGYFLYIALGGGMIGLILGGETATYPAFTGWYSAGGDPLAPILFITIACGACSGFHSIIASGTTSKQLRRETDAKAVGYGAMLLEGMVAVVSLCCVMMVTPQAATALQGKPNFIYAQGIGSFLGVIGIPASFGISFGLLAFTTFVYDTLDVCTRLGRYILQELTGWSGSFGRWATTALTAGAPLFFVTQTVTDAQGKVVPAWRLFWGLFGASNQLLAALSLLGVTVWLWRTYRARWVWLVAGLPTLLMYVMSTWALLRFARVGFVQEGHWSVPTSPVPWVAVILVGLAGLVFVEALRVLLGGGQPPRRREPEVVAATAG